MSKNQQCAPAASDAESAAQCPFHGVRPQVSTFQKGAHEMDRKTSCTSGQLGIAVTREPGLVSACSCLECQKSTGFVFNVMAF